MAKKITTAQMEKGKYCIFNLLSLERHKNKYGEVIVYIGKKRAEQELERLQGKKQFELEKQLAAEEESPTLKSHPSEWAILDITKEFSKFKNKKRA